MAGWRGGRWLVLGGVALATLTGCDPWRCSFESHGACVEFATPPADLDAAKRRMDTLLALELPYWGLSNLDGWRIQYRNTSAYPCYLATRNDGCTDYINRTLSVRVHGDANGCFEAAELLHELGHYALGDPMHSNDHWGGIEGQFSRIVWDRPGAPPECLERYHGIVSGMWTVNRDTF